MRKNKIVVLLLLATIMVLSVAFAACNDPVEETPHTCGHVCETCHKCTSDCTDPACAEKCQGHQTPEPDVHTCNDKCIICGKCTSDCTDAVCADKCQGHHKCQHVCPVEGCGKCLDPNCTESACADKCPGHNAPKHVCESVCDICEGCQNADCDDEACSLKCNCAATLAKAVDNVKSLYGSLDKTSGSFDIVTSVSIYDKLLSKSVDFTVAWAVEVAPDVTEPVTLVNGTDKVTVTVGALDTKSHPYTLVATVSDLEGNSQEVRFELEVPAIEKLTVAQFVEKKKGDELYQVEGWIVAVNKIGEAGSFVLADETGSVFSYDSANVTLGDKVAVVASRDDYSGFPQLATSSVEKLTIAPGETFTPVPTELAAATILSNPPKDDIPGYTGKLLKITGATLVKNDSGYLIGNYNDTQVLNLYMNSDIRTVANNLVGSEVVVYGYTRGVGSYLTVQLTAIEKAPEPEKTDAEKVADAKALLSVKDIYVAGSVELTATSGDVAITWKLAETTLATLDGNKLTVAILPVEESTITLTATLTCGEATDTKEITVNITPLSVISIADFLTKEVDDELYVVEGWCVAANKVGEAGSFVLADDTGAVFSYNNGNVEVGKKYLVYGKRAVNYGLPQIGTTTVVPVETDETFVEPTATEWAAADIDLSALGTSTIGDYAGKYYKITGTIYTVGQYVQGNYNNAQLLSLYMNSDLRTEYADYANQEVVVYGYVRGCYTGKYLTIQVTKVELPTVVDTTGQTADNPYTVAQIIEATKNLANNSGTAKEYYLKGIVKSFEVKTSASGEYVKNLVLVDEVGGETSFTVSNCDWANGVTTIAEGDTVVIKGGVYNSGGTITMNRVTANNIPYPTFISCTSSGTVVPPVHTCGHVCATCGKCTSDCDDAACADKCQGHTVVEGNDGTSIEKAYSVAEIISATSSLGKNEYTESMLFVKGIVVSFSSGNFVQNLYLADAAGNTETFLVYSANFTDDVKSIAVGDTIVVKGAVKNYKGTTLEMTNVYNGDTTVHGYPTIVALVSAGQGTIAVASGSSEHATVAVTDNQTEGTNHTTFTFKVTVDDDYEIVSVTVGGNDVTADDDGLYTGTILGATTIFVETKEKGAAEPVVVATLTFSSETNGKSVSGYTTTWTAMCGNTNWSIANFNNNQNQWAYIKCGRKDYVSVAYIATINLTDAITKVVVTIDKVTTSNVNSIKLIVASDADFANVVETIDGTVAQGKLTFSITNVAANQYYKVVFDCKTGSNGSVQVSKVEYYALPATTEE